ncbi:hypothetical protein A2303_01970 [Candidatus Falkowbacteria bacterium RIFOXYB2_FULL_47_14]|uniref:Uncharacterized protein n=1 Tax=Candidatus Falkowbacteria bacterium RIFOXYA2_FULL_47_19 TaxID=1797994 RepID=A0A1F5SNY6_9BACT|nr:MAG: hypothetical protein A2227_06720 [Candidatus Falkowbacteria bacterium RIFOXYA2_FULL_47_19]OGF34600.1 MAG: hypothetical protein A2468_07870 [Candidatus Falkowbacteria bacterium RIFOXYC2_FULL_46_15]OGF43219.1 MAG: hypothetical protein A2303_01970 [Candidatus Falkowbacteria bacterium RIFOXYB2_FULL_47_14]
MIFEPSSPAARKKKLLIVFILVLLAGFAFLFWTKSAAGPENVSCPQDAKLCPDGSSVGRVWPGCDFAPCLSEDPCGGGSCPSDPSAELPQTPEINPTGWKTATDDATGVSFRYPDLTGEYVSAPDWPPLVRITDEAFACAAGGTETEQAGETAERMINGRLYCVTKIVEGAAGSVYEQYAYAFPGSLPEDKTVIFNFSIKTPQCGNYDEPEKTECGNEQASFNLDGIIDEMALSVSWPESEINLAEALAECLPKSDSESHEKCQELLSLIHDFDDCVAAGFSIMKSNPPQCATPDGRTFTEEFPDIEEEIPDTEEDAPVAL